MDPNLNVIIQTILITSSLYGMGVLIYKGIAEENRNPLSISTFIRETAAIWTSMGFLSVNAISLLYVGDKCNNLIATGIGFGLMGILALAGIMICVSKFFFTSPQTDAIVSRTKPV